MSGILIIFSYLILFIVLIWFLITLVYTELWAAYICLKGSKSFFFASMFYPLTVRNRIFIFYSFARLGDDLIDDYKGKQRSINLDFLYKILDFCYNKTKNNDEKELKSLLEIVDKKIKILPDTFNIINIKKLIINLKMIINECKIPRWSFELLLYGFKCDTEKSDKLFNIFDENDLLIYSISVASSIGIICTYLYKTKNIDKLLKDAISLGIAFQITNIARDIITDLTQLNKVYIPMEWIKNDNNENDENIFNQMNKNNKLIEKYRNNLIRNYSHKLIKMADIYYIDAWTGIKSLPSSVRFAIYSALLIYRQIGINILHKNYYPNRSFVPLTQKLKLLCKTSIKPNFFKDESNKMFTNKSLEMLKLTIERMKSSMEKIE